MSTSSMNHKELPLSLLEFLVANLTDAPIATVVDARNVESQLRVIFPALRSKPARVVASWLMRHTSDGTVPLGNFVALIRGQRDEQRRIVEGVRRNAPSESIVHVLPSDVVSVLAQTFNPAQKLPPLTYLTADGVLEGLRYVFPSTDIDLLLDVTSALMDRTTAERPAAPLMAFVRVFEVGRETVSNTASNAIAYLTPREAIVLAAHLDTSFVPAAEGYSTAEEATLALRSAFPKIPPRYATMLATLLLSRCQEERLKLDLFLSAIKSERQNASAEELRYAAAEPGYYTPDLLVTYRHKLRDMLGNEDMDMLRDAFIRIDFNGDGYLLLDEVTSIVEMTLGDRYASYKPYLLSMFHTADVDQDGRLDIVDFLESFANGPGVFLHEVVVECVSAVRVRMTDTEVNALEHAFVSIDTDEDGMIDREEMSRAIEGYLRRTGRTMSTPMVESIVRTIFDTVDRDNDGLVSRSEFIRAYQEDLGVLPLDLLADDIPPQFVEISPPRLTSPDPAPSGTILSQAYLPSQSSIVRAAAENESTVKLRRVFDFLDRNGNGSVTLQDVLVVLEPWLRQTHPSWTTAQVEAAAESAFFTAAGSSATLSFGDFRNSVTGGYGVLPPQLVDSVHSEVVLALSTAQRQQVSAACSIIRQRIGDQLLRGDTLAELLKATLKDDTLATRMSRYVIRHTERLGRTASTIDQVESLVLGERGVGGSVIMSILNSEATKGTPRGKPSTPREHAQPTPQPVVATPPLPPEEVLITYYQTGMLQSAFREMALKGDARKNREWISRQLQENVGPSFESTDDLIALIDKVVKASTTIAGVVDFNEFVTAYAVNPVINGVGLADLRVMVKSAMVLLNAYVLESYFTRVVEFFLKNDVNRDGAMDLAILQPKMQVLLERIGIDAATSTKLVRRIVNTVDVDENSNYTLWPFLREMYDNLYIFRGLSRASAVSRRVDEKDTEAIVSLLEMDGTAVVNYNQLLDTLTDDRLMHGGLPCDRGTKTAIVDALFRAAQAQPDTPIDIRVLCVAIREGSRALMLPVLPPRECGQVVFRRLRCTLPDMLQRVIGTTLMVLDREGNGELSPTVVEATLERVLRHRLRAADSTACDPMIRDLLKGMMEKDDGRVVAVGYIEQFLRDGPSVVAPDAVGAVGVALQPPLPAHTVAALRAALGTVAIAADSAAAVDGHVGAAMDGRPSAAAVAAFATLCRDSTDGLAEFRLATFERQHAVHANRVVVSLDGYPSHRREELVDAWARQQPWRLWLRAYGILCCDEWLRLNRTEVQPWLLFDARMLGDVVPSVYCDETFAEVDTDADAFVSVEEFVASIIQGAPLLSRQAVNAIIIRKERQMALGEPTENVSPQRANASPSASRVDDSQVARGTGEKASPSRTAPYFTEDLRRSFDEYDTDRRGVLQRSYFQRIYQSMESYGLPMTAAEVQSLFDRICDRPDVVTFEQFCVLMLRRNRM